MTADIQLVMSRVQALKTFFSLLPVPLYRSSPDGTLLVGNEALARLLGYESSEQMLTERKRVNSYFINPEERNRWMEQISNSRVVYDFDIELQRRDGTGIWVRDTARVVTDENGDVIYFEGALIDVTDRVLLQRSKDEFVATVSHEVRNPIAVVLGMGRELANDYDSFSDEERREMIQLIAREADEASWLIDDLLVAHHADSNQVSFEIEPIDVLAEVERVISVFDGTVNLDGGHGVKAMADSGRVRQIIRNLVSNARRYGGGDIRIGILSVDETVVIKVSDSGGPIPPESLDQIFEPFGRAPGTQNARSVGLGLTVCKTLAELMGGTLRYAHEDGRSCFRLALPTT